MDRRRAVEVSQSPLASKVLRMEGPEAGRRSRELPEASVTSKSDPQYIDINDLRRPAPCGCASATRMSASPSGRLAFMRERKLSAESKSCRSIAAISSSESSPRLRGLANSRRGLGLYPSVNRTA